MLSRTAQRSIPRCCRAASSSTRVRQAIASEAIASTQHQARFQRKQQQLYRSILTITLAGSLATLTQYYLINTRPTQAETPQQEENPIVFEKSRKQPGLSREENRDLISSQHHQVKRSWENPGLYAWGSNTGRVVAPDRPEDATVKTPRRLKWFDGKLLRDVKLDRNFGAAIDERGDLVQWGISCGLCGSW